MSATPERLSYKFQRLREQIRQAIERGQLTGKLPGERELARMYGVNPKTVSKALCDLTAEGVLVRVLGKGTYVAGQTDHEPVQRERKYRWVTTAGWARQLGQKLYARAEEIARQAGHQLHLNVVEPNGDGELPERCLRAADLRGISGVVIFGTCASKGFLADLLRRHIPVVLANSRTNLLRCNTVSPDYARGAFELCEHLIGLGHRHIELLWQPRRPDPYDDHGLVGRSFDSGIIMLAQARRGYQTAMRRHGLTPATSPGELAGRPPVGADEKAAELLDGAGPTPALLCAGTEAALAVLDEITRRKLRVPDDVSLALLAEPGQTGQLDATVETLLVGGPAQPPLTAYEFDGNAIVDWTMQVLLDDAIGPMPQDVIIPGRLVDRGSVKPVPGAQPGPPPDTAVL